MSKPKPIASAVVAGLLFVHAAGCAVEAEAPVDSAWASFSERFRPPTLPHEGGTGDLAPWGGNDASRRRPEATLANAASAALNDAVLLEGARDAVIAVPLRMLSSDLFPYGDGQSNAAPSFEGFPAKGRVPLVAMLVDFVDRPSRIRLRFDRALGQTTAIELFAYVSGETRTIDVAGETAPNGDVVADFPLPDSIALARTSDVTVAVHPKGWHDWFPLSFEHHVAPASTLAGPAFADGRGLLDRERISMQGEDAGGGSSAGAPFARLSSHTFAASYNFAGGGRPVPYTPTDVHGRFPFFGRSIVTAVGSGFTWVADERPAGIKALYTCFTGRRPAEEAAAPDGGVTSGPGWHRIGDPSETIVNNLERGPFVVAHAKANPLAASSLAYGGFAWGLTDVATLRWLRPGEAFVTRRGPSAAEARYHWFFFHRPETTCAELFTHPE